MLTAPMESCPWEWRRDVAQMVDHTPGGSRGRLDIPKVGAGQVDFSAYQPIARESSINRSLEESGKMQHMMDKPARYLVHVPLES
jgi:hypothetical protein